MSNEFDLLRMLEPAVRPGGLPGPTQQQRVPIESRDFESLLEEARKMNTDAPNEPVDRHVVPGGEATTAPQHEGLMQQLAGVNHIENGSLRHLLTGAEPTSDGRSSKADSNH